MDTPNFGTVPIPSLLSDQPFLVTSMRRFLLHVLPSGFHRIRHYGLFANAARCPNLATARALLEHAVPLPQLNAQSPHGDSRPPAPTFLCQHCGAPMIIIEMLPRAQNIRAPPLTQTRS
jgi:Putative transposase